MSDQSLVEAESALELGGSRFAKEPEIEILNGFLENFSKNKRFEVAVCLIEYLIVKDLTRALDLEHEFFDLLLSKLSCPIDIQ